jgi:hypothetical protein
MLREEAKGHFRLGIGFLATALITESASECEVRNALSRSYYALFHMCNAWLASENVPGNRRSRHGPLQIEIARRLGVDAKRSLVQFYRQREDADYRPEMVRRFYSGDHDLFRMKGLVALQQMRDEFERYRLRVKDFIESDAE